jgi:hypothetical protein
MAFTVAVDFTRIYAILEIVAPYRVEDKTWIIFWASILYGKYNLQDLPLVSNHATFHWGRTDL